jgi:hypothetical protein
MDLGEKQIVLLKKRYNPLLEVLIPIAQLENSGSVWLSQSVYLKTKEKEIENLNYFYPFLC